MLLIRSDAKWALNICTHQSLFVISIPLIFRFSKFKTCKIPIICMKVLRNSYIHLIITYKCICLKDNRMFGMTFSKNF